MPRKLWGVLGLVLAASAASTLAPSLSIAETYDLIIDEQTLNVTGRDRPGMVINGQFPGAPLRLKEGENVTINVINRLDDMTSIHWHGLLLPSSEDGVPGVSDGFHGIAPGETFTYNFPIIQAGTYWFHSHSAVQEQLGVYAPIVIEPLKREPFRYDHDYIIQLSDWTDEDPNRIIKNLKRDPGYYNYNKQTWSDLISDIWQADTPEQKAAVVKERWMWGQMRMDRTDIADVTGYTFLVNGQSPERNFTALFKPGERVRLRFINSSAMTYFDVRIPGLKMTVVQADGNNVQPTPVDEFRIAVSETYDVIVQPTEDKAYSILGESMDRAGFARATLAPREGMIETLPPHRPRPILTMADMGMSFGPTGLDRGTPEPETDAPGSVVPMDMEGMGDMAGMGGGGDMAGMDHSKMAGMGDTGGGGDMAGMDHSKMAGMGDTGGGGDMAGMDHSKMAGMGDTGGGGDMAGMDHSKMAGMGDMGGGGDMAGMDHGAMSDPINVDTGAPAGAKVLSYRDLKALASPFDAREPDRIIEIRLTGNMERYFWSINGNQFSEAQPIVLKYGERVRFRFINETMMNHPMHLHGMWMLPRVGNGARDPMKHVLNIKPGTSLDADIEVDAEGGWAFHCHLLYHMETGMMRKVIVERQSAAAE